MTLNTLPAYLLPPAQAGTTVNAISPFRYPGGKRFLSGFLRKFIELQAVDKNVTLAEPFCGGAGASLTLLEEGSVDNLHLNDLDVRVYSAWKAITQETERFLRELERVPVTIQEWRDRAAFIARNNYSEYNFDIGFSTFFINRTSRSGIISRSGPIGGYRQTGAWNVDARFNKDNLSRKIERIGQLKQNIALSNTDGISFLAKILSGHSKSIGNYVVLIDPPYFVKGGRLYLDEMSEAKHVALADLLEKSSHRSWILTYDDCDFIRNLYSSMRIMRMDVKYCLQNRRKADELLITHPATELP